mmetsp:Transcript_12694/g.19555  ORF Transcript_12694/g.19555 Transcript_12694/m.19555 type:complete len:85 (-) Transcript_12694:48-302(-)
MKQYHLLVRLNFVDKKRYLELSEDLAYESQIICTLGQQEQPDTQANNGHMGKSFWPDSTNIKTSDSTYIGECALLHTNALNQHQ